MPLIVSVSGIRGIVGDELTSEIAVRYAAALGHALDGGPIALGRDSRPSGNTLRHAAIAGLAGVGCTVHDLGIIPTPTCGFLVRELGCRGGLMITASHNPAPYNGLKLFGHDGAVLSPSDGANIQRIFESSSAKYVDWNSCGQVVDASAKAKMHIDRVVELINASAIQPKKFRIVLDANGGAGGPLGLELLNSLGCNTEAVYCSPDGIFRHEPEPTPAHLASVAQIVRQTSGAIGFALDPDSDRLALIDENGQCLSEELTLALAVRERLHQDRGPIAINFSTSRVTADVAQQAGVPCFRAAVGEANVVAKMREVGAIIGGEGNGGVIDPRVGWIRDPFIGMGLILSQMARTGKALAELAADLPRYIIKKDKLVVSRERLQSVFEAVVRRWPEAKVDRTDGIHLEWPDRWLHLRASNTEPIVRVIAESADAASVATIIHEVRELAERVKSPS